MAIRIITLDCPKCGASIQLDSSRGFGFCGHCGAKILIQNDNEYVYKMYDEAKIQRAKNEKELRLKELEHLNNKSDNRMLAIIFVVIGVIIVAMSCSGAI